MAYTPKTWECGETITADALNHIEQGIADSGGGGGSSNFVITFSVHYDEQAEDFVWSADRTLDEILQAWNDGQNIVGYNETEGGIEIYPLTNMYINDPRVAMGFKTTFVEGNTITTRTFGISAWTDMPDSLNVYQNDSVYPNN